ncbi:phosphotransferase [Catellatospora citrea]|uniref:Phosphotransferase n=1 Tax=Catellatospora citrea TaxID=53366 RepID=A0A8J3KQJ6_9ACTN|nr:phosphotransferase [Catellatospora citrea]RKE02861.1 phosphotransferase family enzyme [Catellatospora citrea]GIG01584.1 phosphotransferase [Catellatospora citrea]
MDNTVTPDWAQVLAWIDESLAGVGLRATGPVEQTRVRPWSVLAKVPVGERTVWFKANGHCSTYEARLLDALGRWAPGRVLEPLAIDGERGWSLLPDGGKTLREVAADDPAHWEDLLARHAELQRDLAPRAAEMIALGVPDMTAAQLPGHFTALLDDPLVGGSLTVEKITLLRAYEPRYRLLCEQVAASAVPVTVQHDDLHDANVLVGDGYRFFDWGDASVAHPFAVLLIAMRIAADRYDLKPGDPVLARLRDAYLEPWTGCGTRAELAAEVEPAMQAAKVSRSLSWQRSLVDADPASLAEYGPAVPGWLEELLVPNVV